MTGKIVGVISDTHGLLRPEALAALQGSDYIIHAGDVDDPAILKKLAEIAPVTAVRGHVDAGQPTGPEIRAPAPRLFDPAHRNGAEVRRSNPQRRRIRALALSSSQALSQSWGISFRQDRERDRHSQAPGSRGYLCSYGCDPRGLHNLRHSPGRAGW